MTLMQDKMRRIYWLALALAIISGCSDSHKRHGSGQDAILSRMIYSPNGEPLNGGQLGRPACQEAMSRWFERVDANHDGSISHEEFMADAQAQFRRMDIDHNGYLVPEELERFRQPYRQQAPVESASVSAQDNGNSQSQEGRHRRGGSHGRGGNDGNRQEAPPEDTSDPVMSADTNLDNKVTPEEFMARAERVFHASDSNGDGTLNRDEVLARCPQK